MSWCMADVGDIADYEVKHRYALELLELHIIYWMSSRQVHNRDDSLTTSTYPEVLMSQLTQIT
jgi:hypothetical protein